MYLPADECQTVTVVTAESQFKHHVNMKHVK